MRPLIKGLSRIFAILTLIAMCAVVSHAAVLSPQEAFRRAATAQDTRHKSPATQILDVSTPLPVYTATDEAGSAAVYVFNNNTHAMSTDSHGSGYVIVSADDCVPAVLGYSQTGYVDPEEMPPSLVYWLNEYARQIEYARQNSSSLSSHSPLGSPLSAIDTLPPIEPLSNALWTQNAPFNLMCPMYNGKRCVSGCVATAMSQIMRYHEWPEHGVGSHSYTWNDTTLSVNFADVTFRWDEILDNYFGHATQSQRDAAALLTYCCGVSVNMDYSPTASGASTFTCAESYVKYFDYDKGLRYVQRDFYPLEDWQMLVYNQLLENGPIQYSGQGNDDGHSFVCDGYGGNGYFHIHWGWNGMSDGYFLLTALDPSSQGIGGGESGYNMMQDIIINVKKPVEGSCVYPTMCFRRGFSIIGDSVAVGSNITIHGPMYSYAIDTYSGAFALKCVSVTDPDEVYYGSGNSFTNLRPYYGYTEVKARVPANIPDGVYTVTPAVRNSESSEYVPCEMHLNFVRAYTMTVKDGIATFAPAEVSSVSVSDVEFDSTFHPSLEFEVEATVTNNTDEEFYGSVTGAIYDAAGNLKAYGTEYMLDLPAGQSTIIDYFSTFRYYSYSAGKPKPGTYYFAFVDHASFDKLTEPIEINMLADPDTTVVNATQPVLNDGDTRVKTTDAKLFTTDITCSEGYFAGSVELRVFPYPSGNAIAKKPSENLFIDEGDTHTVQFDANLDKCELGKQYMAAVFDGDTEISPYTVFTVDNTTGLDPVVVRQTEYTIYDMNGIKVNPSTTTPGVYVRVDAGGHATKVVL